ncbi:MAG: MotA/TolQ/ExbB proton channel family protein [Gemmataceae bacterium]
MSHSAAAVRERMTPRPRGLTTVMAFLFGLPLGIGLLAAIEVGPFEGTLVERYTSHPVEKVSVVLFACSVGALVSKLLGYSKELLAFRASLLPNWDGNPLPVSEAKELLEWLKKRSKPLINTYLGRRIASTLEFVDQRQSAEDLDDHLRGLADNDDIAIESSYSLIRFITWAIPILGFLGTVLGITGAVSAVTPEVLEKSVSKVTEGLGTAFDTTAMALALTMVTMFLSFVMERMEQRLVDRVNAYSDERLAHLFERVAGDGGQFVEVVRRNTQVLLQTTEQLIQQQVMLWQQTLQEAHTQWAESGKRQQQQMTHGLEQALQKTVASHAQILAQQEQQSMAVTSTVVDKMQEVAQLMTVNSAQQNEAMRDMMQRLVDQTEALAELSSSGSQIVKLQETLQENLSALAASGNFEQAVNSLNAAIHLLTARVGATQLPGGNRLMRPGAAA